MCLFKSKSIEFCYRIRIRIASVACVVFLLGMATHGHAQQAGPMPEGAETELEAEEAEVPVKRTLDLGRFKMRENRPTSNVTAKVTFEVQLSLSETVDEELYLLLEKWKHRLRDQVLTAARKTETKDFVEPTLYMFRRNIMLRINRMLRMKLVDEVLLTEYAFTTH